jgi:ribosomal protein S18 acetylase RimI-like enzyme
MIELVENLSLRNASPEDETFLKELFFDVRGDEFAIAGLPAAQLESLLSMQYAAQKKSYEAGFPGAVHSIIEFDGKRIGRQLINRSDEKIHLIDIAILREFRGKGIGSYLLDELKSKAKMVSLSVYKNNHGAIRLYERHGFAVVRDDGSYLEMEWKNA